MLRKDVESLDAMADARFQSKIMTQGSGDINSIWAQLDYKANLKFRFSALLYKTINAQQEYGDGEYIRMLDAHILKDIDENPGILSVDLAQAWCRTRSAICVIVQRLEDSGYIVKQQLTSNKKERALYATEKGHDLCEAHRRFDARATSRLINEMLGHCTMEEIDAYFKVLEYQIECMQKAYSCDEEGVVSFHYQNKEK